VWPWLLDRVVVVHIPWVLLTYLLTVKKGNKARGGGGGCRKIIPSAVLAGLGGAAD